MQMLSPALLLSRNFYPGRGIVLGRSEDGQSAIIAYFIMGRSENSRNRVFTKTPDGIVTEAADPAKMQDPSLIIYAPVRKVGRSTVVTNGDQTDTICAALLAGRGANEALRSRTFEPDEPNYTPRISGVVTHGDEGFCYTLSILKSALGNAASVQRFFFEYPQPLAGQGHLIHTYEGDGNPLPSFSTEPVAVALSGSLQQMGDELWGALNPENKVALYVCSVAANGAEEVFLYNSLTRIQPV